VVHVPDAREHAALAATRTALPQQRPDQRSARGAGGCHCLPFFALFGVGISAPTALRQSSSFWYSFLTTSGLSFATFFFSPTSSFTLYSSSRPSSKNSINFQSPERTAPAGVVRQRPLPWPR